ncbi:uncharacterized protein LOC117172480 [Belonocnema kinseyi]|uniref:uncharacterized protein LOC117172480 n=1 Tax=Belonocnema kinseyi TaxID=2817044 RepID=UPI00143D4603|nr:uncharacterized protein LOC117172480 [Belonocnema kinseyi]
MEKKKKKECKIPREKVKRTMDTKNSFKHGPNFFDGENVGRDSPGALLDMLAEVASQTLHSEKEQSEKAVVLGEKSRAKSDSLKRKNQDLTFNVLELSSMPTKQLVKQFSIFTSDELKRQYSYVCALLPDECDQKYTSFASEGRARMSIKAHLEDHLENLKSDQEAYSSFTATAVIQKKSKTNMPAKKSKINRSKKPQETLNKENKEIKSEKATNYLRNILTNEFKFSETENSKEKDSKKDQELADVKVLGDHSYFEATKDSEAAENLALNISSEIVTKSEENIMLMVVQSDGVHMKEVPYVVQKAEDANEEPIYLPDPIQTEEVYAGNMEVPVAAKPKGKAKFIGTSTEEKEMALLLMERIKKKGNPSGNNLQCRICDPPRTFTAPTTLVSHYRSHAGIKPYECRTCGSVFTRRHSLKYHMLIHQNQTRFTCADCGKKFRHPSHFREHRRRHTGEAPFGCEDCGQRFKTRNTYKRHLKTRHGKVLTTSGELLHLSEEDFQKVRTSRKRVATPITERSITDEDMIAPEAILQYEDSNCDIEESDNHQDYKDYKDYNEFVDEDRTVWMTENMLEEIKGEEDYGNYEVEEDHERADKTDFIETEVAENQELIHSRHLYDGIAQEVCNKIEEEEEEREEEEEEEEEADREEEEESAIILDGTVSVDLEIARTETPILYEKNFHHSEELYSVDEYEREIQSVGEEILGYQESDELSEEHILEHDGQQDEVQDESERPNFHQDSALSIFCSNEEENLLDSESPFDNEALKMEGFSIQGLENFSPNEEEEEEEDEAEVEGEDAKEVEEEAEGIFPDRSAMDYEDAKDSGEINEEGERKPEIKEDADEKNHNILQSESVFNLNLDQREKVRVESCGVPISQFQNQPNFQISKDGKISLFGKEAQTINLVQNGKQSAILLLTNGGGELNRNFFKFNQNKILVKGLKTLPVATASDLDRTES